MCSVQSNVCQVAASVSCALKRSLSTIPVPGTADASTNDIVNDPQLQTNVIVSSALGLGESLSIVPVPGTAYASTIVTVNESQVAIGSLPTLPAAVNVDTVEGAHANEEVASDEKSLKYTCVPRPTVMLWQFCVDFSYEVQVRKRQALGCHF